MPHAGCYGDGPGKLDTNKGKYAVNTGWMNVDTEYILMLKLEKGVMLDDREAYDQIRIQVLEGARPKVIIT